MFVVCGLLAVSPAYAGLTANSAIPDKAGILILIRTTLSALNDANRTGNYTVLRDLGAPGFRDANSAARLSDLFSSFRKKNLNIAPVTVVEPTLTQQPAMTQDGYLYVSGLFPTSPLGIEFELLFEPINGEWKLFGIRADTRAAQ